MQKMSRLAQASRGVGTKGVFRYFIVDVVDPESTPDVARCGRELDERTILES
ncbi:hypothetical protein F2Q69_00004783 [Brassica cretica]|uniref:Uncharacterized protein n=1 Tax=Brassica cretica TaxID=69181 RepID=A0A8S9PC45_BRACR|nr:hypothetical protein F2Q69_00004783 [Brassica cretica]